MKIELPLGDIVDRYSILSIKKQRIQNADAQKNIRLEYQSIRETWAQSEFPEMESLPQWHALLETNQKLWTVEDLLREREKQQMFDPRFIELARSVYILNDQRANLKRGINLLLGSVLLEEKSYSSTT